MAVLPIDRRHESQVILPVAFLLAAGAGWSVQRAYKAIEAEPRVSVLLGELLSAKEKKKSVSEVIAM